MNIRAWSLVTAAAFAAALECAVAGPPPAQVWNIAATGRAESSGDLHFRITQNDGSDPVDITVPVIMGAKELTIARSIRNSLGSQLRRDRFRVELGEGTNVLVSDQRGQPNFSIELIDSDIDSLRVAVQSVTPTASPTVPTQETPAEPPLNPPAVNSASGTIIPPAGNSTQAPGPGMQAPDPGAAAPDPGVAAPKPGAQVPATPPLPNPMSPAPGNPSQGGNGVATAPPPTAT